MKNIVFTRNWLSEGRVKIGVHGLSKRPKSHSPLRYVGDKRTSYCTDPSMTRTNRSIELRWPWIVVSLRHTERNASDLHSRESERLQFEKSLHLRHAGTGQRFSGLMYAQVLAIPLMRCPEHGKMRTVNLLTTCRRLYRLRAIILAKFETLDVKAAMALKNILTSTNFKKQVFSRRRTVKLKKERAHRTKYTAVFQESPINKWIN